jgi:uncharacterized protein
MAYDVYDKVARGGYWKRVLSMLQVSLTFPLHVFMIMNHMFKVDGVRNQFRMWVRGLWWLYGPGGLYPRLLPHYLTYFKPGFHPWKHGDMDIYRQWVDAFNAGGGDAIAASDEVMARTMAAAA